MEKDEFIEFLCQRRPQCNARSAKTHWYTLIKIYKLYKKSEQTKLPKTSRWVKRNLLEKFEDFTPTKKRNFISTLVVYLRITKATKSKIAWFCDQMYQVVKKIRKHHREFGNQRTERQKRLWIAPEHLEKFYKESVKTAQEFLNLRRKLVRYENFEVRDSLMVIIHNNPHNPPPRNDWATAVFSESAEGDDEQTKVYRVKTRWFVGIYGKTKKARGQSKIPLKAPFSTLLAKYIKKNKLKFGDRLFTNNSGNPFTASSYGAHIRAIFKKRFGIAAGTSMLRVMYISNKYKMLPQILRDLEMDAKTMMHNSETSREHYLKHL